MADKLTELNIGVNLDSSKAKRGVKTLKDEIKSTSKAGSSSIGGLGGSFGNLALKVGGAVAVFGTLASGISKVIQLQGEQEQAEKQLETALKSTNNAVGMSAHELKSLASSLQSVTTFGDEAIIEAQSLMLTFTKVGKDVFPQATETILNMSQAMGTGLKEQTIQLGKALNDPIAGIGALSRVGVQLSQTQKDQIKSFMDLNDVASAQKIILGELETQFGGQARASAETLTGSLEQMTNSLGDMGEAFGNLIAPIVIKVANGMKSLAESVSDIINGFDRFVEGKEVYISAEDEIAQKQARRAEIERELNNLPKGRGTALIVKGMHDEIKAIDDMMPKLQERARFEKAMLEDDELQAKEKADAIFQENQNILKNTNLVFESEERKKSAVFDGLEFKKVKLNEDIQISDETRQAEIQSATEHSANLAKIDAIQLQSKARLVSGLIGSIGKLAGQNKANAKVAKRLAQVQALIDTFSAGNVALKSFPPPFGAIAMATVIAQGLANVSAIESQKFANGGVVNGRGGVDTIPASLTAGEFVINRTSARAIGIDKLNKLNRTGFYTGGMVGGIDPDAIIPSSMQTVNISGNVLTDDFYRDYIRPAIARNEGLNLA